MTKTDAKSMDEIAHDEKMRLFNRDRARHQTLISFVGDAEEQLQRALTKLVAAKVAVEQSEQVFIQTHGIKPD